jgi:hypothetical protein
MVQMVPLSIPLFFGWTIPLIFYLYSAFYTVLSVAISKRWSMVRASNMDGQGAENTEE